MTHREWVLVLAAASGALSAFGLITTRGKSVPAWAGLLLAIAVVLVVV